MYIIDSSRSCLVLLVYHSMIDKLHILSGLRTTHGFILVLFICLFVLLYFYLVFFFPLRSNTTGAKILSYYLGLQNTNGDSVKSLIKH